MDKSNCRTRFGYIAAGALLDGDEAHLCVLGEDGWPHYTSVKASDPAQWRRALATLADPSTPTLGKHRRPTLRKPVWLGLELAPGAEPPMRLLALVLLPKGKLSFIEPSVTEAFAARVGSCAECRFDRAELLANFVLRNNPDSEDGMLKEAGDAIGLLSLRARARG